MPRFRFAAPFVLAAVLASPTGATADEILNALDTAREAYEAGRISEALTELSVAQALLRQQKAVGLQDFLPEAPEGWSREIDGESAAALTMFGGGTSAEATYSGNGDQITLLLLADSPMITSFATMLNNPTILMAAGGKLETIGGQRFAVNDGEYTAMIANRILVQASGDDAAAMTELLGGIDFTALAAYQP